MFKNPTEARRQRRFCCDQPAGRLEWNLITGETFSKTWERLDDAIAIEI
jgi:hypothetical protein